MRRRPLSRAPSRKNIRASKQLELLRLLADLQNHGQSRQDRLLRHASQHLSRHLHPKPELRDLVNSRLGLFQFAGQLLSRRQELPLLGRNCGEEAQRCLAAVIFLAHGFFPQRCVYCLQTSTFRPKSQYLRRKNPKI